jgi:hypothetical protein
MAESGGRILNTDMILGLAGRETIAAAQLPDRAEVETDTLSKDTGHFTLLKEKEVLVDVDLMLVHNLDRGLTLDDLLTRGSTARHSYDPSNETMMVNVARVEKIRR